ncbi:TIGR00153 family protein [bacterium]|nr:TIGR00153 family protein [bacterium]
MSIFRRFTYNPFEPLQQLLDKIDGCVGHIEPMFEANFIGEYDVVKDHFRAITRAEHEADEIKNKIRDGLKRSLFLPIDRWHFLEIISAADKIADRAEDLGFLLTVRHTVMPPELRDHFKELVAKVLECYNELTEAVDQFDALVESGFSGPVAEEMAQRIDHVCHLEWESDKIVYKLSQHLFQFETTIPLVDLFFIWNLSRELANFADSCERLAKQVRRTITH